MLEGFGAGCGTGRVGLESERVYQRGSGYMEFRAVVGRGGSAELYKGLKLRERAESGGLASNGPHGSHWLNAWSLGSE